MSRNINPAPQFLDINGDPIVGGKMYYFKTGTSTPLTTFSDKDETTPNTHPVILDSSGRLPNVFFTGSAKQVLDDSNDVQIWERDPVGGDVAAGAFTDWDSSVSYDLNDIVEGSDNNFYKSLSDSNQDNDPVSSPEFWEEIRFISVYNANVDYDEGRVSQTTDGIQWRSVTTPNIGNDPATDDGSNWVQIGVSIIDTPTNVTPANSAIDVPTTPTLSASAFSSGTDVHVHSQWQIATDSGFTAIVYDSSTSDDLEAHTVPTADAIDPETVHYWRVRYFAVNGVSSYSAGTSFTTEVALSSIFATTTYTGTSAVQAIVSGIDFFTGSGFKWFKERGAIGSNILLTTARGLNEFMVSDTNAAESTGNFLVSDNVDGFTMTNDTTLNNTGDTFVCWQFLEQAGFFDIVSFTGNSTNRTVTHNVNETIGLMIVKTVSDAGSWAVWHKDMPATDQMFLDDNSASGTDATYWNSTAPTASVFSLGTQSTVNFTGRTYEALLFAHNPPKGIFCGSYTGTGAAGNKQTTGIPTGWLLTKKTSNVGSWHLLDNTRSPVNPVSDILRADLNSAEFVTSYVNFLSDGFEFTGSSDANVVGEDYIYMVIADPAQF